MLIYLVIYLHIYLTIVLGDSVPAYFMDFYFLLLLCMLLLSLLILLLLLLLLLFYYYYCCFYFCYYYYCFYVIFRYSSIELLQVFVHLLLVILLPHGFYSLNLFVTIWELWFFLTNSIIYIGTLFSIYLLNCINCVLLKIS